MIVAVTGASGHLGGVLVRELIRDGHHVKALVRAGTRTLESLSVTIVRGDILDPRCCDTLVEGAERVFHCAAYVSTTNRNSRRVYDTNVTGTLNVVNACAQKKTCRLVHVSSIHAFAPLPPTSVTDETSPILDDRHGLAYERSKAAAERVVLRAVENGLDAVICNPTAIIGPYDFKPSMAGAMILSLLSNRLIALVDAGFDWLDVRDAACGVIAAGERGKKGERYILSGNWHTLLEIARMLSDISMCRVPGFVVPMWLARIAARIIEPLSLFTGARPLFTSGSLAALRQHRKVSSEKAHATFEYTARPLRKTIRDVYYWFRDSGMIKT